MKMLRHPPPPTIIARATKTMNRTEQVKKLHNAGNPLPSIARALGLTQEHAEAYLRRAQALSLAQADNMAPGMVWAQARESA